MGNVDILAERDVTSSAPELSNVADCIALVESAASQVAGEPTAKPRNLGPSHIKRSQSAASQVELGTVEVGCGGWQR
jgi:hypothetical protein